MVKRLTHEDFDAQVRAALDKTVKPPGQPAPQAVMNKLLELSRKGKAVK